MRLCSCVGRGSSWRGQVKGLNSSLPSNVAAGVHGVTRLRLAGLSSEMIRASINLSAARDVWIVWVIGLLSATLRMGIIKFPAGQVFSVGVSSVSELGPTL